MQIALSKRLLIFGEHETCAKPYFTMSPFPHDDNQKNAVLHISEKLFPSL
ncbi:hypothetical protein CCP2SC5_420021 [Azospirillaceae bacterium]